MNAYEQTITYVIIVVGIARLTRLLTVDAYPPAVKLREWWERKVNFSEWSKLAECIWCAAPWITLIFMPVLYFAGLLGVPESLSAFGKIVWLFFVWLAAMYAASMVVRRDGDD